MATDSAVKLIECPRDAMQGLKEIVPTPKKIEYINALLAVGFDTVDFGSFVSPKAIPQMADTAEVVKGLDLSSTKSKLLAIVANQKGAEAAADFDEISYLGFPFSVSETFQQRNTNAGIGEAMRRVNDIQDICAKRNKKQVVYISMGFGNPYGDSYDTELVLDHMRNLENFGVQIFSMADTVGVASREDVYSVMKAVKAEFSSREIGIHLHAAPEERKAKTEAALKAGCGRFDSAMMGFGGCPMAGNDLVGNLDTDELISTLAEHGRLPVLNEKKLKEARRIAAEIFHS